MTDPPREDIPRFFPDLIPGPFHSRPVVASAVGCPAAIASLPRGTTPPPRTPGPRTAAGGDAPAPADEGPKGRRAAEPATPPAPSPHPQERDR